MIGAADMGTGCDTTLAQIAAEVLDCPLDNITVFGADTDTSPYDSGSYASSTTYVTGKATEKCAMKLRAQICKLGAELLECTEDDVEFDGRDVFKSKDPAQKKASERDRVCFSVRPHGSAGSHRNTYFAFVAAAVHGWCC